MAIAGDYAIVGAAGEDENAAGGNTQAEAGSAYVFKRGSDGVWQQVQKIVTTRPRRRRFVWLVGVYGGQLCHHWSLQRGRKCFGRRYEEQRRLGLCIQAHEQWHVLSKCKNWWQATAAWATNLVIRWPCRAIMWWWVRLLMRKMRRAVPPYRTPDRAYIFKRGNNGMLSQVKKIVAYNRTANNYFGWSVAISGNGLIVGAPGGGEGLFPDGSSLSI